LNGSHQTALHDFYRFSFTRFRLHQLLSELEANGLTEIMSWQPHGKAFRVNDKERFVKEILPM